MTKLYGDSPALRDVDLEIRRGEFITLLGPSGSGKSTTLLLIAGFELPTSGEIYLDGTLVTRVPPHRRRIGMVFQNYALFPHLSVFENVAFALRNLRWAAREIAARVHELLGLVQLEALADRLPGSLSGGQQQRVALARALAFRPSLLLLDEPIAALDKRLREQMLLEFRRIHQILGTTMVFVTHDQEEALVMSDRIAVMDKGEVVQVGTPRELYDQPSAPFVAEFLGDTNVLAGVAAAPGVIRIDRGLSEISVEHGLPVGSSVHVVIRPEKIIFGEAIQGWNHITATVEEALYLGGTTRYRLRADPGQAIVVKEMNNRRARSALPGERVLLSWHSSDAHIIGPNAVTW